ncbi:MAG: hypothetical protein HQL53_08750 [Magnetococcales bacterium]|nr:hypothetical protein [Magnetococcales bacterium]
MQILELKQRLREGHATLGAWLTVQSPMLVSAMVSLGFEWLAVDFEHGVFDMEQSQNIFITVERYGALPLVRLPSADPYLARRLLDAGAQGVLVPVVEDPEAFQGFIDHCLYKPHGRRGVGLSRCNRWGDDFKTYLHDFQPLIVAQIETKKGVRMADQIAALPAVDALMLGPYDLSADLGIAGDFGNPRYQEAAAKVLRACLANGKAPGMHQVAPDEAALMTQLEQGFKFIAYGTDVLSMRSALQPGVERFQKLG